MLWGCTYVAEEYIWYVVLVLYSVEGKVCFGVVRSSRIRTVFGGGLGNSVEGRVIRVTRLVCCLSKQPSARIYPFMGTPPKHYYFLSLSHV